MKRNRTLGALLATALLLTSLAAPTAFGATKKSNVKKLTFTATTVSGTAFNSKVLLGNKPSVLWFWAPWCAICANESAAMVAASQKYKNRINFIGVGALGNKPELQEFIDKTGTSVFTNIDDSSGAVWKRFGVIIQPTIIFVDRTGKITTKIGPSTANSLEKTLKTLAVKR
jgi:thiol-disulfide isomerase/thioredoxin